MFEWDKPQEIVEHEVKKLRLSYRKTFSFTLIAVLLLEVFLLIPIILILQKCGPEHAKLIPNFTKSFFIAGLLTAVGIPLFFYVIDPILLKRRKVCYQITRDAFIIKTDGVRKLSIPWAKISFFWVTTHEPMNYRILNLFYKKTKASYPLPDSELFNEIISFVSSMVSLEKDDSLIEDISIPFKQKLLLLSLTGLYGILILAGLYYFKKSAIPEHFAPLAFFIFLYGTLFLGPGTMGMMFFYRPIFRKRKDLRLHAIKYNLGALLLVGFVSLLYAMLKIYSTLTNAL